MAREHEFSRRAFLGGVTGLVATSNISAAGQSAAPLEIAKTVQKLYKVPESREPNDLQFVPEGLWILDQVDPNRAILVVPEDGSILRTIQTESLHGSGITFGDGGAVDRLDLGERSIRSAENVESRPDDGQDTEVLGHDGVRILRTKYAGQ